MKALSLWQPWASLMAAGLKTIETRSWPTGYRGSLAIHAAKRKLTVEERALIQEWRNAGLIGWEWAGADLPLGAIVAVVELVDCVRTIDLVSSWYQSKDFPKEQEFGNFVPGRYAWITRNPRAITPIPYRGRQGLFDIPDEILEGVVK